MLVPDTHDHMMAWYRLLAVDSTESWVQARRVRLQMRRLCQHAAGRRRPDPHGLTCPIRFWMTIHMM